MDDGSFDDVAASLPRFIEAIYNARRRHSALGYKSPVNHEEDQARPIANYEPSCLTTPRGARMPG